TASKMRIAARWVSRRPRLHEQIIASGCKKSSRLKPRLGSMRPPRNGFIHQRSGNFDFGETKRRKGRLTYRYLWESLWISIGDPLTKPKADVLQGTLALLVLKTLARGPLHGYGITLHIQRVSKDVLRVEEGSLYPALHRMEQEGWIRAEWGM